MVKPGLPTRADLYVLPLESKQAKRSVFVDKVTLSFLSLSASLSLPLSLCLSLSASLSLRFPLYTYIKKKILPLISVSPRLLTVLAFQSEMSLINKLKCLCVVDSVCQLSSRPSTRTT